MGDPGERVLDAAAYVRLARSGCFVCAVVQGRPLLPDPQVVYEDGELIAFLNHFPQLASHSSPAPQARNRPVGCVVLPT